MAGIDASQTVLVATEKELKDAYLAIMYAQYVARVATEKELKVEAHRATRDPQHGMGSN